MSEFSDKNFWLTLLLCIFLGIFGAHRFYVGKVKSGLLMLATLGGLGIWFIIDISIVGSGHFTDSNGGAVLPG